MHERKEHININLVADLCLVHFMAYGGYSYLDEKYSPARNDIIMLIWARGRERIEKIAEAIAAESSIGTWTKLKTLNKEVWKLRARVFRIDKIAENAGFIYIAYPLEHFEIENVLQLSASVFGNLFGLKELYEMRILDITFPRRFQSKFEGPLHGMEGLRKYVGTLKSRRPHVGTIVKPKVGLNPKQFAKVAYESYMGGIDFVKDDENLVDQKFCRFKQRVNEMLKIIDRVEKRTGRKVLYSPNITARLCDMMDRIDYLHDHGWVMAMIDVYIIGFGALQDVIDELKRRKMFIHAHRAGYGALERGNYGISFGIFEKFYRLFGVDELHVGTGVGKMEGSPVHVRFLRDIIYEQKIKGMYYMGKLDYEWNKKIKTVFPVASGGLNAGLCDGVAAVHGRDVIMQAGGGVHGHPGGTRAGAKSMLQAAEAISKGIPLPKYAKTHKELKAALKRWGYLDPSKVRSQMKFTHRNKESLNRLVEKTGIKGINIINFGF